MSNSKGLFVFLPSRKHFSAERLARLILVCLVGAAFAGIMSILKNFIVLDKDNTYALPKDSIAEAGLLDLKEPAFLRLPVATVSPSKSEGFGR